MMRLVTALILKNEILEIVSSFYDMKICPHLFKAAFTWLEWKGRQVHIISLPKK